MRIVIINGSPKGNGNSRALAHEMEARLASHEPAYLHANRVSALAGAEQWGAYDALVFCFPLYIDAVPSHLFEAMCRYAETAPNGQRIYAVVNCGFYEGAQNGCAMEILQNWCEECGLAWGGGVGLGAGEMLGATGEVPIGHGPHTNLGKALDVLCRAIQAGEKAETYLVSPNFPRPLYRLASTYTKWLPMARKNGVRRGQIRRRLSLPAPTAGAFDSKLLDHA